MAAHRVPRSALVALLCATLLSACTVTDRGVELAVDDFGIGLGNSEKMTGLRINLSDADIKEGNGLNLSLLPPGFNGEAVLNGLNFGLMGLNAAKQNGLNISTLLGGEDLLGLNAGLLRAASDGDMAGINLGAFGVHAANSLAGLNLSTLVSGEHDVSGISAALLAVFQKEGEDAEDDAPATAPASLDGLTISGLLTDFEQVTGISATGILKTEELGGLSVAYITNLVDGMTTGLAVAPFNWTERIRGLQLGLLNYVGSNPHPFKVLPLLNFGFDEDE